MMADLERESANAGRSQEALAEAVAAIPDALNPASEAFAGFTGDLAQFFSGTEDEFKEWVKGIEENFEDIGGAIEGLLPTTREAFDDWRNQMTLLTQDHQNFEANLTTIYKGITAAGVAMPDDIIAAVAAKGPTYAAQFAQWYAEDPQKAIDALAMTAPIVTGEMVNGVVQKLTGLSEGASLATGLYEKELVTGFATAEAAAVEANRKLAEAAITQLEDEMVGRVQTASPVIGAEIVKIPTDAEPALSGAMTNTGDLGAQALEDAMVGGMEGVGTAVGGTVPAIKAEMEPAFASSVFSNFGENIWAGIKYGAEAAAAAQAYAMAQAMAASALSALKGAFKVSSPSELTHDEVGIPIGQGIVTGMADGVAESAPAAIQQVIDDILWTVENYPRGVGGSGALADIVFGSDTSIATDVQRKTAALAEALSAGSGDVQHALDDLAWLVENYPDGRNGLADIVFGSDMSIATDIQRKTAELASAIGVMGTTVASEMGTSFASTAQIVGAAIGSVDEHLEQMIQQWADGSRNLVSITQALVNEWGGDFFEMESLVHQFTGEFINGEISISDAAFNIAESIHGAMDQSSEAISGFVGNLPGYAQEVFDASHSIGTSLTEVAGSFSALEIAGTEGLGQLPSMLQQWADGSRNLVSVTQWMTDEVDGNFFEVEQAVQQFAGAFINGEMDVAEATRGILDAVGGMATSTQASVERSVSGMLAAWADGTTNLVSITQFLVTELGIDFFEAEAIVHQFSGAWANGEIAIGEAASGIASAVSGMSRSVIGDVTDAMDAMAALAAAGQGVSSLDPSDPLGLQGNGISNLYGPGPTFDEGTYSYNIPGIGDFQARFANGQGYINTASGWVAHGALQLDHGVGEYSLGASTIEDLLNRRVIRQLAQGMPRVPFDGMLASLHRDEAVLNAAQARQWRAGASGGVSINLTVNNAQGLDEARLAKVIRREIGDELEHQFGYGAKQWGV
jgi:hypothetical protein